MHTDAAVAEKPVSELNRRELLARARALQIQLPPMASGQVTNQWLREQIGKARLAGSTDPARAAAPSTEMPLLHYAQQVLDGLGIQPPLSDYRIDATLDASGQAVNLELSCRVGGVTAEVNTASVPHRIIKRIEGLGRSDFFSSNATQLKRQIEALNAQMRTELGIHQGHLDASHMPIPLRPELKEDPAEYKARGDGPQTKG